LKIRNPKTIRRLTWLAHKIFYVWLRMVRVEFRSIEHDYRPEKPYMLDGKKVIYCLWHEYLLVPTLRFGPSNLSILVSEHADGEIIAQVVERFGISTVRGSSNRKAVSALLGMMRAGSTRHLGMLPDGPRGPRRVAQAGTVYIAMKTGMEVVPVGIGLAKAWRAKSWDRFAIPKPFSRGRIVFGRGFKVPADTNAEGLKGYLEHLQKEIDRVTHIAEHWATTGTYDPDV